MQGINIAGVQFRRAGKIYNFSYYQLELRIGDQVVVDSEKGASLAEVVLLKYLSPEEKQERPLKPILRKASHKDLSTTSRLNPEEISDFTKNKILSLNLSMRLLKSEVQFGGAKVVVYFTAPGRVDFRELVKELASGLKVRVELKQVGARDETKLLGGLGICGREYCCSSFLREFVPVSIRMAKNQNLALNPSKVSGGCGRLLCCLTYENDVYSQLRQLLPPRGTRVKVLSTGELAMVLKSDLLNQMLFVENEKGQTSNVALNDISIESKAQNNDLDDNHNDGEWGEDFDLEELSKHI